MFTSKKKLISPCITYENGIRNDYENNETINIVKWIIYGNDVMFVVLTGMLAISLRYYVYCDSMKNWGSNIMDPIMQIQSNNVDCVQFCKALKIDIFTPKRFRTFKPDSTNISKNVLEAMLISNNLENYIIIRDWYQNIVKLYKHKSYPATFDEYLQIFIPWNFDTMIKMIDNCDSTDYYILLHRIGFNLTILGAWNRNLLHMVCWYGHVGTPQIIKWILQRRIIDVNAIDMEGFTCLHYLIIHVVEETQMSQQECQTERQIARILLLYGIDQTICGSNNMTAMQMLNNDDFYQWLTRNEEQ